MGLFGLLKASLLAVSLLSRPDSQNLVFQLHSEIVSERLSAIQQLSKLPPTPEISEALVDALADADPQVVKMAAARWGKIAVEHDRVYTKPASKLRPRHTKAEEDAVLDKWQAWQKRLIAQLGKCVDSPDPALSKAAARSLALMGGPVEKAFSPHEQWAGYQDEWMLSFKADRIFAEKMVSRETTLRELFRDKEPQVVYRAAWQLSKVSTEWLESRIPALSRDSRSLCRILAIGFGPKSVGIALIGDPDKHVRQCAALAILTVKGVMEVLAPQFNGGTVSYRLGVSELLRYGTDGAPEGLIQTALLDENSTVRAAAIGYAVTHRFTPPENYILACLRHPSANVRCAAVPFLYDLNPAAAQQLALGLIKDRDGKVRERALDYLQEHASIEIIPPVIAAYRRYNDMNQFALLRIIRLVGPPAEKYIRKMLVDQVPSIRVAGLSSARDAFGKDAVDILIRATDDSSARVRWAAIEGLGSYTDPRIAPRAIRLLADKDQSVVVGAIRTLGYVGGREAREALHRLESSNDDEISLEARYAIKALPKGPADKGE